MLCSRCLLVLQQVKEYQVEYKLHNEESSLRRSLLLNCNLCAVLADFFCRGSVPLNDAARQQSDWRLNWPEGGVRFRVGYGDSGVSESHETRTKPSYELNFFSGTAGGFESSIKLLRIVLLPVSDPNPYAVEYPIPESTSSADSYFCASAWLGTCTENHKLCKAASEGGFIPTRLVQVRFIGSKLVPRVCNGEDLPEDTKYLTLSHCWADSVRLRLLSTTIDLVRESVPLSNLNHVMRDAVEMTARLGFEYIWIDSLCIIQDSSADWERESALMGRIYKMATMNIAATAFADGNQGLFSDHHAVGIRSFEAEVNSGDHSNLIPSGRYRFLNRDIWIHGVEEAPLNSRGWVVQERLLSPRVLHFGEVQLYWECQELQACEAYPKGLPEQVNSHISKHMSPLNRSPAAHPISVESSSTTQLLSAEAQVESLYSYWNDVVYTYGAGNLTYATDKLVAISGLAMEVSRLLPGDEYLAGMWRRDLPNTLTWSAHSVVKGTRPRNSTLYRGPSWSWASVDGDIIVSEATGGDSLVNTHHIEVLDAHVEYKNPGANDLGQLTGGSLRLRGPLVRLRFTQPKSSWGLTWKSERVLVNKHLVEVDLRRDAEHELSSLKFADTAPPPGYLFCLPIRTQLMTDDGHFALEGLLLQPTGHANGEYRRIGMFAMNDETSADWFRGEEEPLNPDYYQAFDGEFQYTLTII